MKLKLLKIGAVPTRIIFSDWTVESYSVPSQYKNIVMELAEHLGYEYKKKYFGTSNK